MSSTILAGIDPRSFSLLVSQKIDEPIYSHDLNILHFLEECLNYGHCCFISANQYEESEIYEVYLNKGKLSYKKTGDQPKVNIILYSGLDNFALATKFPEIKHLVMQSALNFVEEARTAKPTWPKLVIEGTRKYADYIIVQNERMKDLTDVILSLFAGWKNPDRILVFPQSPRNDLLFKHQGNLEEIKIRVRHKYGIPDDALLIVNAGGVWKWTNLDKFLLQLKNFIENGHKNVYFIQPGIVQTGNHDHDEYINDLQNMIASMQDSTRKHFILLKGWNSERRSFEEILISSDLGINLNPDTLENWQSHRVRVLEYISAGLPTLISQEDSYYQKCPDFFIKINLENEETFAVRLNEAFKMLENKDIEKVKSEAQRMYSRSNSYQILAKKIDELVSVTESPYMEKDSLLSMGEHQKVEPNLVTGKIKNYIFSHKYAYNFLNKFKILKIYKKIKSIQRKNLK